MNDPFCPHCGVNFTVDRPIDRDGWTVSPSEAVHCGQRVDLTAAERLFLYSLAKAGGRPISIQTLSNRICESLDPHPKNATVHAAHLRQKLSAPPFHTVRGVGYAWGAA